MPNVLTSLYLSASMAAAPLNTANNAAVPSENTAANENKKIEIAPHGVDTLSHAADTISFSEAAQMPSAPPSAARRTSIKMPQYNNYKGATGFVSVAPLIDEKTLFLADGPDEPGIANESLLTYGVALQGNVFIRSSRNTASQASIHFQVAQADPSEIFPNATRYSAFIAGVKYRFIYDWHKSDNIGLGKGQHLGVFGEIGVESVSSALYDVKDIGYHHLNNGNLHLSGGMDVNLPLCVGATWTVENLGHNSPGYGMEVYIGYYPLLDGGLTQSEFAQENVTHTKDITYGGTFYLHLSEKFQIFTKSSFIPGSKKFIYDAQTGIYTENGGTSDHSSTSVGFVFWLN